VQESSDNPSWLLEQAVRSFHKEHYKRGRWLCWMELRRNPNGYFTSCSYAVSLYLSGRHNDRKAASLCDRAIESNPAHSLAHAGLGGTHYSNALRIHREYSIFPGGSWVVFADEKPPEDSENKNKISVMGYADSQVGNRKIAVRELEEAAGLASDRDDRVQLLDMAAEAHCIINNEDGIGAYKKILHIAPDYVPTHFHLADCYAAIYCLHKQSPPTSYCGEHSSGNDKLAVKEYKFIRENAPELASDSESVLANFDIDICK